MHDSLHTTPTFIGKACQDRAKKGMNVFRFDIKNFFLQGMSSLMGTIFQILRMFPDEEKKKYDLVIDRLKSRFKPVDIEKLKSIEFHQKMQNRVNLLKS